MSYAMRRGLFAKQAVYILNYESIENPASRRCHHDEPTETEENIDRGIAAGTNEALSDLGYVIERR